MRVPAYSKESASTGTSSSAKPPCSLSSACSTDMRSTNSRTQGTNGMAAGAAGAGWVVASANKSQSWLDQTTEHLSIPYDAHLFSVPVGPSTTSQASRSAN